MRKTRSVFLSFHSFGINMELWEVKLDVEPSMVRIPPFPTKTYPPFVAKNPYFAPLPNIFSPSQPGSKYHIALQFSTQRQILGEPHSSGFTPSPIVWVPISASPLWNQGFCESRVSVGCSTRMIRWSDTGWMWMFFAVPAKHVFPLVECHSHLTRVLAPSSASKRDKTQSPTVPP